MIKTFPSSSAVSVFPANRDANMLNKYANMAVLPVLFFSQNVSCPLLVVHQK